MNLFKQIILDSINIGEHPHADIISFSTVAKTKEKGKVKFKVKGPLILKLVCSNPNITWDKPTEILTSQYRISRTKSLVFECISTPPMDSDVKLTLSLPSGEILVEHSQLTDACFWLGDRVCLYDLKKLFEIELI